MQKNQESKLNCSQESCPKGFKTMCGGQALIEGIMMRGPSKQAVVVRKQDGELAIQEKELKFIKERYPILGWPLIRGVVNFVDSMYNGVTALMYSAEFYAEGEEEDVSCSELSDGSNSSLISEELNEENFDDIEKSDDSESEDEENNNSDILKDMECDKDIPPFSIESEEKKNISDADIEAQNAEAYRILRQSILDQFDDFHPEFNVMLQEAFDGNWVWINDDPLAFMNQHASMIPGTGLSYISLAADCYLQAAAHELGHAWYNRLIKDQNVMYNANELLLEVPANLAAIWSHYKVMESRDRMLDSMEEQGVDEKTIREYRTYLASPLRYEELFAETAANIFDGCVSFRFERELRSRILKEELTAQDITDMYLKYRREMLMPENRDWDLDPMRWIELHSLYTCRSYYNLPYIVSMILAHRFYQDYLECESEQEINDYWNRMTDFIQRMNRMPVEELLAEHFRENIRNVEFWKKTIVTVLRQFTVSRY